MKTVQEYLRLANKEDLISLYLYKHPIQFDTLPAKLKSMTVQEITDRYKKRLSDYIDRMINIEIEQDADTNILFVHIVHDENVAEETTSLVHFDELKKEGVSCNTYSYEFTKQSVIAGFYVADLELTQENIRDLLVDVLFGASFFGFEQEELQDAIDKIEKGTKDIEEGNYITHEEMLQNWKETFGYEPRKVSDIEMELKNKIYEAEMEYNRYMKEAELNKLIDLIQTNKDMI